MTSAPRLKQTGEQDEIARLKGEKGKPKIKPSRLEPSEKAQTTSEEGSESLEEEEQPKKKRPGSAKRDKTALLPIHETTIIQPGELTSQPDS